MEPATSSSPLDDAMEVSVCQNVEQYSQLESNAQLTNSFAGSSEIVTEDRDYRGSLEGETAETIEKLYDMYRKHAAAVGFSVRLSTTRCGKDGVVREKYFVCSCEGYRKPVLKVKIRSQADSGETTEVKSRKRKVPETRTGCNASARVKLNLKTGMYEMVSHFLQHNHPLTIRACQSLHRAERDNTQEKYEVVEEVNEWRTKPSRQDSLMSNESGGSQYVGDTQEDQYNFSYQVNMKAIEGGDAQTLIDRLLKRSSEETDFFFRVKFHDSGRISALYLRDSMMKEDYGIFGDVSIFDTKHRTNRYNFICAPFFGINNHWQTVMFGCAFIGDENIETFEWVFEMFKESMGGKMPVNIFTDEDQAVSVAISRQFPNTRHRLCLWHLEKNAVSHLGLCKRDESDHAFKDEFKKCLTGFSDEEEFEECWKNMIAKYGLEDHDWFESLYDVREKWCTALNPDFFSAGILSTQRSECASNAIRFKSNRLTSLTDLLKIFEETVVKWRRREESDEFQCNRSLPVASIPLSGGLLKHAAEFYTLTLFRDFEQEFLVALDSYARPTGMVGSTLLYEVAISEDYMNFHTVTLNSSTVPDDNRLTCTCKNFEEVGWLCFHIIRVMHMHSIFKIPKHYISKRWTKEAKSEVWAKIDKHNFALADEKMTPWRQLMARRYYSLVLKCGDSPDAQRILEQGYKRDLVAMEKLSSTSVTLNEQSTSSSVTCIQFQ